MNINKLTETFLHWISLLLVAVAMAWGSPVDAQPVKAWDKDYGGSGWEDCNTVQQTADFGYILGGITTSGISGDVSEASRDDASLPFGFHHVGDFWVLRTDENGDYLWDKRYGGNKEDRMWGVRETNDGGFILGGQSYSDLTGDKTETNRGDSDYWIVKTDADGNYEWDHTYGGDSTDVLNVLIQTQDGGYMLGGWSISSGWSLTDSTGEKSDTIRGNFDWWVVKIDDMGTIEWEKTFGGDAEDRLNDIIQLADGTYLLGGGTDSEISGEVDSASYTNRDYWLLQIDSLGDKIGEWRYGGNGADELNSMIITNDGGRLLGGSSTTLTPSGVKTEAGYGSYDWWLIKTDSAGNVEWQHTFGSDDLENIYSVSQNSVDHYLLGGFSRSAGNDITDPPKGSFDFWIMYLDPDGNKLWDRRCGGNEADVLENLFQTNDGGYLLTGHSQTNVDQDKTDPNNGLNDFWIVKTNCNISVNFNDTIVCPNEPVMLSAYDPSCIDCLYSWEDDGNISDSIRTVTTATDVTYSVTLTDGVGCQKSDDINITVFTPPTVDLGEDIEICKGSSLTLDAENFGLNFLWNTGDSTQNIDVNYPDRYIVSVTNAMGCTTPDSIEVSLSDLTAQVITTNTSCGQNNGTVTVFASGGTGNYSYTWITGGSGNMLSDLSRGEYAVVVNDGNCQVITKGIVGFEELPSIDWEKNYGGSDMDLIWDIKETSDGGFITIGASRSNDGDLIGNSGQTDVWVKKLSSAGNIEWQRTYGGSGEDAGTRILPIDGGGYIFIGYTSSPDGDVSANNGGSDVWVVQIDAVGNILWEETYGGSSDESAWHIEKTMDEGYIISGNSRSADGDVGNNFGGIDGWVLKIGVGGLMEWEHNYGGTNDDEISVIRQLHNGNYIFGAHTASSDGDVTANYGLQDYWLVNIDRRGNIVWQRNYGGSDSDRLADLIQGNNGGYILTGSSLSIDFDINNPQGGSDYWVIKVDQAGNIIWENSYGSPFHDFSTHVFLNGDGNYVINGYSEGSGGDVSENYGLADFWMIKIDVSGNLLWEQNYGGTNSDYSRKAIQTSNGGYLLAGTSLSTDLDVSANYGGIDEWIIKLNVPPLPNVALPDNATLCLTDTIEIAPIISTCESCAWQWSDGSLDSLRVLTPLQSIDYEIVITDTYGCTASDQMTITVNEWPVVLNLLETCNSLNTSYTVSFEISNGLSGTYSVTGDAGTLNGNTFTSDPIPRDSSYVFYVDDANGCGPLEIIGSFDCPCVTDAGFLDLDLYSACGTEIITIDHYDANLDGNDLLQFILHDGDATTVGDILYTTNFPVFNYFPELTMGTTYYVAAIAGTEDGNGNIDDSDACYSVSEGTPIIFYESPSAIISPLAGTELTCEITSLFLSGENSTAQGSISFEWTTSDSGNIISNTDDENIELNEPGFYTLLITDNSSGCIHEATIEVTINEIAPEAEIQSPNLLTCRDSIISLDAGFSSMGNNFTYVWTGGSILSGDQTLFPEVSESTFYTLMVTDENNGCTAIAEVFVEADFAIPIVNAGPVQFLDCIDTELILSGTFEANTSNIDFQWRSTGGNFVSGQHTLNPVINLAAIYTLQVTNLDNGCIGWDEVVIENDPEAPQDAIIEAYDPECYGDKNGSISITQVIGGMEPYNYSIDGENFFPFANFTQLTAGNYPILIQDARGCEWSTTILLAEPPELLVDLGDNIQIELGDSVQLQALVNQAVDTFFWNPGASLSCENCLNPFVYPLRQSTYHILVETASGCQAEDYITVVVRKDRKVYVPNTFSPNGDDINDFFTIYGDKSVINISTFRVFDRWGELLFEAENFPVNSEQEGWNGFFKNKPVQQGVYIFFAEIEYVDGLKEIIKGDITVMF